MNKTKIGISVAMMAAAAYLIANFGGYIAILLLAGYILLAEENAWLKKSAVKSVAVLVLFSLLGWIVGLIPSLLSMLVDFVQMFDGNFYPSFLYSFFTVLSSAVTIAKSIVMIYLALMAAKEKDVMIPVLDKLLDPIFE